jgi:hypothetical protein
MDHITVEIIPNGLVDIPQCPNSKIGYFQRLFNKQDISPIIEEIKKDMFLYCWFPEDQIEISLYHKPRSKYKELTVVFG